MNGRVTLVGLVVAAFVATIAFSFGLVTNASEGRRVIVEIQNFEFAPEKPAVRVGDVVVWKNLDIVPHTVTSKGDNWDSGKVEAGGEWETVVTDEMVHDYYCKFHPSMAAGLSVESE